MANKAKGAAGMAVTRRQNITLHYRVHQAEEQLEDALNMIEKLKEENNILKKQLDEYRFPIRFKTEE